MLGCVEKCYGKTWDLKTLTTKANQKCCDSKQETPRNNESTSETTEYSLELNCFNKLLAKFMSEDLIRFTKYLTCQIQTRSIVYLTKYFKDLVR